MKEETTKFIPGHGMIGNDAFKEAISNAVLPITQNNKRIRFYNLPCAFDTEVSSFYYNGEKCATMYIWQFGLLNWVTYGRTWDEFIELLEWLKEALHLDDETILICYVHNLAYEFQFMRKHIQWNNIFFMDERKPLFARWSGIEFRCSLRLSSKSLAKVGEDLIKYKEHKHLGDLDYQKVRFSTTPLTEKELAYCEGDIRVLLAFIQEKIEQDGTIYNIPLTNTGYVRRFCRKKCFQKFKSYRRLMDELTISYPEYKQLKRGFAGGFVHGCAHYVLEGLEAPQENVGSIDFISSYIEAILLEPMPMSRSRLVTQISDFEHLKWYLTRYCCLFDATLTEVEPRLNYDHPVSSSRLIDSRNVQEDNGRVVRADSITLTFTELDWFTFDEFYDYKSITVHEFRYYEKGYLPKELILAVLELYRKKTELKGITGKEVDYMIYKGMLNACYGMMVTDIVRELLEYDYENGDYPKPTEEDLQKTPEELEAERNAWREEQIKKYNESKKRFLFFPWGVWVTAVARRNLFNGIKAVGDDYIYSDTDSIKMLHPERHMDYVQEYNNQIHEKIKKVVKFFHSKQITVEMFSPKNKKGSPKTVGAWEFEGTYRYFKTLGAKRYLVQNSDGSYALTVAGVNKQRACEYLEEESRRRNFPVILIYHFPALLWLLPRIRIWTPFDIFSPDLVVPSIHSGRLILTYKDEPVDGLAVDCYGNTEEFHELSIIHMEPCEYQMTMSSYFRSFIKFLHGIVEDSW